MTIKIHKCNILPTTLEPDSVYLVKGEDSSDLIVYATDKTGRSFKHTLTRTEVLNLIDENGSGIIQVDELPEPSEELAGRLYSLNGVNIPCWCTGTEWLDLSKSSGTADPGTGEVITQANKLYRNESVFGIKIL